VPQPRKVCRRGLDTHPEPPPDGRRDDAGRARADITDKELRRLVGVVESSAVPRDAARPAGTARPPLRLTAEAVQGALGEVRAGCRGQLPDLD